LGPLFFVIMRLIKDVAKWVFIFVIFMVSFQLAIMALTSEAGGDQWEAYPTGTFAVAFFTIIGDYSYAMETMDKTYLGVVILAIYALISQIMLVNLLIAMMGDTYSGVKENSDKEWRFYRCIIVYEYKVSSSYPPPFNFIVGPFVSLMEKLKERKTAINYLTLSANASSPLLVKQRSDSTYLAVPVQLTQKESFTQEGFSELEQKTIKKLKMGREKVIEKEEAMERESLKSLSANLKEQLRLMSSQRDSDRKHFELELKNLQQQLKKNGEQYEAQVKNLKDHNDRRFDEMFVLLKELQASISK